MAAIARVRQLAECFAEILAAFGIDRLAQIRKRRLALILDELRKWNALEYGKELRCVGKVLLHTPQFVIGELLILHFAGIGKLEMSPLGPAHDVC